MFYKLGGRRPPNCDGPLALEIKETEQNNNKESWGRRPPLTPFYKTGPGPAPRALTPAGGA